MSTPFNAATAAYGNVSRLISDQAGGKLTAPTASPSGTDFGQMLADQLGGIAETGQRSDQVSVDMINGKANVVDVVTALAETESAMETMVTVRDRVISAYEEIMRMPI
ncbi:flagellar hook-basal body complex protein FliE [Pelagibacterium nitratireducens]|uniref:Flagellar hook-basal body complex protein FliE n=1 Tax=Pelagibacterium nitratireducens TaxID=1046114 RepID=A0ABZ2I3C1_9HYPH|nr:flagellar hook-basal body protein FliE [Pelagibacterium sp.]HCO54099.1 flagellar hook-basal body protein FliE [Pelagibacterium sp.]|tara:strand:+ start:2274 stop:2597 length:324 start_codon:yes stop_codon:yes gene_type:complete